MTHNPLDTETAYILTVNGGSSSIKFAVYAVNPPLHPRLKGKIDRIGLSGTHLTYTDNPSGRRDRNAIDIRDHSDAARHLIQWLQAHTEFAAIRAVGHRLVHGMHFTAPQKVTPELLRELHHITPYDPDHLPVEIALIEIFRRHDPQWLQVACFDTAFHRTMPRMAKLLPIPRRYDTEGIQRYGFHGLSYAFLMQELTRIAGKEAARGRIILAHLGSGASMAAVKNGRSVDTTMGFTPAAGMPMGTRSGDLDPGLIWFWLQNEHLSASQVNDLINHQSGLLGVSESSSDLRDLLSRETDDIRAAEAVEMFCHHGRKWIGALAATLEGLDILVFSGGIGENAAAIRSRICDGLAFLGVDLDDTLNSNHAPVISSAASSVTVYVIPTDEEVMIAKNTLRILREENPNASGAPPTGAGQRS